MAPNRDAVVPDSKTGAWLRSAACSARDRLLGAEPPDYPWDPGGGAVIASDDTDRAALLTALAAEHAVLQNAASSTVADAAQRSSLYVFALSSAIVAMGFMSQTPDLFFPFVAAILPANFVLGVLTVIRLVDTSLENNAYMAGIARVRSFYRTLSPEAEKYFAPATGRWPETLAEPSLGLGELVAFLGTTASMIAFINSVVGGATVSVLLGVLVGGDVVVPALIAGAVTTVVLMAGFLKFERWRFEGTGDVWPTEAD